MGKPKKGSQENGTAANKESSGKGKRTDPIMRLEIHAENELDATKVLVAKVLLLPKAAVAPLKDCPSAHLPFASSCCCGSGPNNLVFGANSIVRMMAYKRAPSIADVSAASDIDELIATEAAPVSSSTFLSAVEAKIRALRPVNQSKRSAADAILGPAIHKALMDVTSDDCNIYPVATTYLKELMCEPGVTGAFKEASTFVRECLGGGGVYELELNRVFREAICRAYPVLAGTAPIIMRCREYKFGDFQCNSAMSLNNSEKLKGKVKGGPKAIAEAIVAQLEPNKIVGSVSIVKTGIINIRLKDELLVAAVKESVCTGRGPAMPPVPQKKVAVDFSSPNIAKEMHVGHLRSTIIGDTITRILEFSGHDVLRINHVGDWGTQFGMLITYLRKEFPDFVESTPNISDLTKFYKAAKKAFDDSEEFKNTSRNTVVQLQGGDETCLKAWKSLCDVSRIEFQKVYDRLQIDLVECGESFYNSRIPSAIKKLNDCGLVTIDNGARICMLPHFTYPLIVQKSDGGYGYDSTDVACIRYRLEELHCDEIIYITELGQETHFHMIFDAARAASWVPDFTRLEHVGFGVVQGEDGKKFKTRSGETVPLVDLLDEAVKRMELILRERMSVGKCTLKEDEVNRTATAIGYGAVKYFDLRQHPRYVRVRSILRVGLEQGVELDRSASLTFTHPSERQLAYEVSKFPDVILEFQKDLIPTRVCDLLYGLAVRFSDFVTQCRVLGSDEVKSRLLLCEGTANTMETCLRLLGITPIDYI